MVSAYERLFIKDKHYEKDHIWGFYLDFINWALIEGHSVIAVSSPPGGSDSMVSRWAKSVEDGSLPPFTVEYHPNDLYATSKTAL